MTTEEFQKIVLDELRGIKSDINDLKKEQGDMNKNINAIHEQTIDLTEFRQETKENFIKIQIDILTLLSK